jgi:hypothetical protein
MLLQKKQFNAVSAGSYFPAFAALNLGGFYLGVARLWAFTTVPFFFVYDRTCTVLGWLLAL